MDLKFRLKLLKVLLSGPILFAGAPSGAIVVEKRKSDIILKSSICQELEETIPALVEWTRKVDGTAPAVSPQLINTKTGCELVATSILPKHVRRFQGFSTAKSGPNCFNLALVMSGILSEHRYVDFTEMDALLKSPRCQKIPWSERPSPGDIGVI